MDDKERRDFSAHDFNQAATMGAMIGNSDAQETERNTLKRSITRRSTPSGSSVD